MLRVPLLGLVLAIALIVAGCIQAPGDLEPEESQTARGTHRVGGLGEEVLATAVFPGTYNMTGPYSRVLNEGPLGIKPAQRVVVPSPIDGVDILMGLHLPATDEPVPVLLFASPYFGFLGSTNEVTDVIGAFGSLVTNFVPHGYAVVGLAIRGTGGSGGCNDLMGPLETGDLDAAVTWLGTQSWSNGNVAMIGVSYDGSTPWGVASTGNKHLKTIIPISGVPNLYELMYRNGTAELRGPVLLNLLYYGGNIAAGTATPVQMAERAICPTALEGVAWSAFTGATGMKDRNGWWDERNRKPGVAERYTGSVFSVQGLQDWNVDPSQVIPWVDQLESQGIRTKQLLGQWGHAWPDGIGLEGANAKNFRADFKEILLRWLDQELKGIEQDTGPPVQVRDNLGRWRNEAFYPPRDADWTTLHLTGGELAFSPGSRESIRLMPTGSGAVDVSQVQLPLDGEEMGLWVDFRYGPVAEDMLVVGTPRVHLAVTPDGPGGYIAAYLYESTRADGLNRIGWTSLNLGYADGTDEYTPVIPGTTIQAKLQMEAMDAVVRAGNELVLRVWVFTDVDRIPALPPTPVTLELGASIPSVLKLSTIERDEDVYFTVPTPESPTVE
jgi:predicted acyl esterase